MDWLIEKSGGILQKAGYRLKHVLVDRMNEFVGKHPGLSRAIEAERISMVKRFNKNFQQRKKRLAGYATAQPGHLGSI